MPEVATATAAPVAAPSTATAAPIASAGAALAPPPPQVNTQAANWFGDFKNDELRSYVQEKKFTGPEQMAERYKNLESLRGVPEDRLLKLPEKMEGPEAKVIWEKLGTPKDVAGYEFDEKGQDPKLLSWAKETFLKNNMTKSQGQSLLNEYNQLMTNELKQQNEARTHAILQADEKLKSEWGNQYETNLNLAKQGAKVLGIDSKTLDVIEALQGRESLFKTLKGIGVAVGESSFVDGGSQAATTMSADQAQAEIKQLLNDKKFVKAMGKGDQEARQKWDSLNRLAAPGDKTLG